MPSYQRRAPSSGPTHAAAASPAPGLEADDQDLLGNSAISGELPTHRGSEVKGGFDPAVRTTGQVGDFGALIGRGETVVLRADASSKSKVTQRVPDGTPCEILEVDGGWVKVSVRVGTAAVEGWASSQWLSKQPDLYRDEDHPELQEDYAYSWFGGDHSPVDPKGTDTAQGGLGDCFFIASMAAVANANPQAIQDAIKYDPKTGLYRVRFYEETRSGMKEVWIEVDAYLPTETGSRNDPAYAGDPGGKLWPAIMEKAYAQWKGGYDVLGEGGDGYSAMAAITGARSSSKSPSSMREEDVIPYFTAAKEKNLAIYAGVVDQKESAVQTPLTGSGSGPYTGTLAQIHKWNEVQPGTLRIDDAGGRVASARDTGSEGDKTAEITGRDVDAGTIDYKGSRVELSFDEGKAPTRPQDLEVSFGYHGMLDPQNIIIGNHAYAFVDVVDGDKLQFYNPWGSYQPKPITAAQFLEYFDSLATNKVPDRKTGS